MELSQTATARFASVVEATGKPEVVSLWTRPERDKRFMAAVRLNRVMTIEHTTPGSAKDFGVVGFLRGKSSSYLVFPKSLDQFKDRRIVGIKYNLIQTPGPVGRVIKPKTAKKEKQTGKAQWAQWEAAPRTRSPEIQREKHKKRFKVTVRLMATGEVVEDVQADSKAEAKEVAVQRAVQPDFRRATVTRKVVKVTARD
jgi:hypothetical protein